MYVRHCIECGRYSMTDQHNMWQPWRFLEDYECVPLDTDETVCPTCQRAKQNGALSRTIAILRRQSGQ